MTPPLSLGLFYLAFPLAVWIIWGVVPAEPLLRSIEEALGGGFLATR
jgi:hypothetical protein